MAYRLKSVRYQNRDCKILLQNENGPCPLLAAANALLLKGVITLPSECVRNGVASIDDVVNLLAERALAVDSEHHLHELMEIFPNLQYGMDVNPKFTTGPTGVEYTSNVTAFDMMNVQLVHGWLLDPQDTQTFELVGTKSYNELVEMVIKGKDASSEADKILDKISKVTAKLEKSKNDKREVTTENQPEKDSEAKEGSEGQETRTEEPDSSGSSWVTVPADVGAWAAAEGANEQKPTENDEAKLTEGEQKAAEPEVTEAELRKMHDKVTDLSVIASHGTIINSFLLSSSHQLTHYGLHALYEYLEEESLSVFFRNNHFATVTKKGGVLYLLVTDLGYANVPEVMWEKIDGIDGNTEYVNALFVKPVAQSELKAAAGPTLDPEHMLAQRGQSEADYQLAIQLSKHGGDQLPHAQLDEQEGKLVAAATEASLREYNGAVEEKHTQVEIPDVGVPYTQTENSALEDQDRVIAMQLQAQMQREDASEQYARELQRRENQRATSNRQQSRRPNRAASSSDDKSSCVIS